MKLIPIEPAMPPPGPNRIHRRLSVLKSSRFDPLLEGLPLPVKEPLHQDELDMLRDLIVLMIDPDATFLPRVHVPRGRYVHWYILQETVRMLQEIGAWDALVAAASAQPNPPIVAASAAESLWNSFLRQPQLRALTYLSRAHAETVQDTDDRYVQEFIAALIRRILNDERNDANDAGEGDAEADEADASHDQEKRGDGARRAADRRAGSQSGGSSAAQYDVSASPPDVPRQHDGQSAGQPNDGRNRRTGDDAERIPTAGQPNDEGDDEAVELGITGDAIDIPHNVGIDPMVDDLGRNVRPWELTSGRPDEERTPAKRDGTIDAITDLAQSVLAFRNALPSIEARRELITQAIYEAERVFHERRASDIINAIEDAVNAAESVRAEMQGWGLMPGGAVNVTMPVVAMTLANALLQDPKLLRFLEMTQGDSRAIIDALRRPVSSEEIDYGTIGQIEATDDVPSVLTISPHAFAPFAIDEGDLPSVKVWRDVAALQVQRGEHIGAVPRRRVMQVGGFIACIDRSGSMSSGAPLSRIDAAKAVAFALARAAVSEGVPFKLVMFAAEGDDLYVFEYKPEKHSPAEALNGIIAWGAVESSGGTSFNVPLRVIMETIASTPETAAWHGVMISDGECNLTPNVRDQWLEMRGRGERLLTVIIDGAGSTGALESISDEVKSIAPSKRGIADVTSTFARTLRERSLPVESRRAPKGGIVI